MLFAEIAGKRDTKKSFVELLLHIEILVIVVEEMVYSKIDDIR